MSSSLLNNRGYLIDWHSMNQPLNVEFIEKILSASGLQEPVESLVMISEHNDYDHYEIALNDGTCWRLKLSFDNNSPLLKRESTFLSDCNGVAGGKLQHFSEHTLGENIPPLIYQFPTCLGVQDLGLSFFLEEQRLLFGSYFSLLEKLSPKQYYKSIVQDNFKTLNLSSRIFSPASREAIKSHSSYASFTAFFTKLKKETDKQLSSLVLKKKCLGGLKPENIFFNNELFFFDPLHNACLHHPFADFVDLILDVGLDEEMERNALKDFCELGLLEEDEHLYESVYNLQLRKKLAELVGSYLCEVYIFQSRRADHLIKVADTLYKCSQRFRRIPAFLDHQDFLVKTITEPILGVKA